LRLIKNNEERNKNKYWTGRHGGIQQGVRKGKVGERTGDDEEVISGSNFSSLQYKTPEVENKADRSLICFSPLRFDLSPSRPKKKEPVSEVKVQKLRD
jgi:hypothetical protein